MLVRARQGLNRTGQVEAGINTLTLSRESANGPPPLKNEGGEEDKVDKVLTQT